MVEHREQVSLVTAADPGEPTGEAVQQAVAIGLAALETRQYSDYDEIGLQGLFDEIKREGRSQRGIEA